MNELLHLVVIRAGVRVDHLFGCPAQIDILTEIIKNHVAIEHFRVPFKAFFSEAIIIVPRFHVLDHHLYARILRQLPGSFIIKKHLTHIFFAEAQHPVEAIIRADVPTYIETARQVIQRDRANSRHEDTIEHAFIQFEMIPIKTAGMGQVVINLVALLIQYHIREVIILVNDQVEQIVVLFCLDIYFRQFIGC